MMDQIFDLEAIKAVIPHREPFIFVDRIVKFSDNKYVVGEKIIRGDEWYFEGHFPSRPVMPGVLVLEALAQVGCFFCLKSSRGAKPGSLLYFSHCENVKWTGRVTPPAILTLEVVFTAHKLNFWFMSGKAFVDGKLVCSGNFSAYAEAPSKKD
ncbi:MAG: 3-hydroxyacyl-ACP dehydratase FabZ [Deltaproteobacteria bacterium]|nr:3-hydroxyacyl-ACP dehydratase FabZ [Deltaproteobacteria bacterium]